MNSRWKKGVFVQWQKKKKQQKGRRSLKKPKCRFPLFAQELFLIRHSRQPAGTTRSHFRESERICRKYRLGLLKRHSRQNFSALCKCLLRLILFFISLQSFQPLLRAGLSEATQVCASNVSNCRNYATQYKTNAHNVPSSLLKTTSTYCHLSKSVSSGQSLPAPQNRFVACFYLNIKRWLNHTA